IQALAPALTTIFDALGPVITQVADLLMPVFEDLQPILADVAQQIGTALADAMKQLAPHLPDIAKSFGDLVAAVAPLLPQLVRMAVELLPPFLDVVIAVLPQLQTMIDLFTWLVKNVIEPYVIPTFEKMADKIGTQLGNAAKVVTACHDTMETAVNGIAGFFKALGDTVSTVWSGIVHGIAVAVKEIGKLLQGVKIPDWVPGVGGKGTSGLGDSLVQWADAHMATGGLFRGRGTGTSDSNLIAVSDGEFVVNAVATGQNLSLLQAINSGWTPSVEDMATLFPAFATGGLVAGKAFAQSMDPATYAMGGFSRTAIDCSGLVSAVVNDARGEDPFSSRMSTVTEGEWLAARGFKSGIGADGDLRVSWFDHGGGANGHTAMTLSDGTNVESNGSEGVVIGGDVGAGHGMFDHHMYLPAAMLRGGDLGGPAGPNTNGGTNTGGGTTGSPSGATGTGGSSAGSATPSSTPSTGTSSPGANTNNNSSATQVSGTHPLAGLPFTGELFNGDAPWYLADSPEKALANLQTQAGNQWNSTVSDVQNFFQNNWKEMVQTGAAVVGMGATGGGGSCGDIWNIGGVEPMSA
ncbi:hypothetical protein ACFXOH_24090, partial [Bacillus subtilis]